MYFYVGNLIFLPFSKDDFDILDSPRSQSDVLRPNPRAKTTSVGALMDSFNYSDDSTDLYKTRRKIESKASRSQNNLIGGIEDRDRWKTTTQLLNSGGEVNQVKQTHKKRYQTSGDLISPITGNQVADYGDWRAQDKTQNSSQDTRNTFVEMDNKIIQIMKLLKKNLSHLGANGIIGLGRKFRILDDDGSKTLSYDEFKKGMKESKMDLSPQDLKDLFQYFGKYFYSIESY